MKDELLTIQQAAELLGVSTKTLRRWESKGYLNPQRTVGNQRRYSKFDLNTLFKNENGKAQIPAITPTEEPKEQIVEDQVQETPQVMPQFMPQNFIPQRQDLTTPSKKPIMPINRVLISGAIFGLLLVLGLWNLVLNNQQSGNLFSRGVTQLAGAKGLKQSNQNSSQNVLAASDETPAYQLQVSIPGIFGKEVTFLDNVAIKKALTVTGLSQLNGGIDTNNANINAGTGRVTASNIIYSILPGSGITVTGNKQNPTISATGATGAVSSVQGTTGDVTFVNGTGISLDGLTINNTGVTSLQGTTGDVTLTGGDGISIDGTTVTNTDLGSAQDIFKNFTAGGTTISAASNDDTVNFAAGSGITVTGDSGSNTITITSNSSGTLSGLTENGVLYATDASDATSTDAGNTGEVLHGITNGAPVFSAVDLTADVTNVLPTGNGGTGVVTTPGNGQILIGNGSGYTVATLTAGNGIGVGNASGAITLSNDGVLSLTGTGNEVSVTQSTGDITISLPQDIAQTSSPSFASMNLTGTSNQLVLGTGDTATITTAALTNHRTYTFPDGSGTVCLVELNNCSGGGGGGDIGGGGDQYYVPVFTGAEAIGDSDIYDNGKVGIGTTSPEGLFSVSGGVGGQALVSLNNTNEQNILVGSASGQTRFVFDANGDLNIIGGSYEIGGNSVLSSGALGTTVVSSSLTTVGALNVGSIATGFGTITTGNAIQGTDITSTGTTGFTANGTGAGLTFSGINNHIINATSGTLELGGVTLVGDITGNGKNVTGVNNLSAGGSITFGGLSNGIIHVTSGALTSSAVDLTADVTGTLPILNGGTDTTSIGTNGEIAYSNGTGYAFTAQGGSGQILESTGAGAPTWVSAGSVGTNYWQIANGALSPVSSTNDLLLGSNATSSAVFAFTGVGGGSTPTASISGGLTGGVSLTANGVLATTNKQTLQLGNGATGNISVFGLGAGVVQANSAGVLSSSSLNLGSGPVTGILPILNGGTNASSIGSAGSVAYSNGTAYAFTAVGGAGQVLESNGSSAPSWVSVSALNYWNLANGAISPLNETNDLLLGSNATSSAVFAFTGVGGGSTPTASISGGLTGGVSLTANGVLATTNKQTLQLGNGATGNISVFGLGAGVVQANSAGVLSSSSLNLGSGPVTGILPILNGGTNASSIGSAGSVAYSNGTAYAFTAVGGAGQVLESNGSSAPSWVSVSALNYWNLANGAISPLNETNDLLLGSNATSSAVFAFTGVGGGSTPTASISGGLTGGVSLTANGVLATTNKQTLQLGNGATGNISVFGLGAGVVQANSAGVLSSSSLNLGSGPVTGILPILNGGTNASSIGSAGSVAYSNGTAYAFTAVGGAGQVLESNGSSAPSWVSVSALNYWNLANGAISPLNETNDLLLGSNATSSAVFAFTGVGGGSTPTASISGGLTGGVSLTANGVLATTNKQTLQLGNGATGNISVFGLGAGVVQANSAGVLSSSSLNLGSGPVTGILPILNGGTNASSIGSAGSVAYSNGTAYAFTAVGGAGQVLESNGSSAPSWVSVSALNYWNLANGAISPLNETNDLLLGSNATSSAVFAFTGVGGGSTPTASISGGLTGGVSLTANGVLATTNKQTLQLGNGATGNISVFGLGAGVVQANSAGVLSSSSLNLGSGPVTGILPIADGGTGANLTLSSLNAQGSIPYFNGSGVMTTLGIGGSGDCLTSNGTIPGWGSCSGSGGSQTYFQLVNGALSPVQTSDDLLLGSTATSSAVFAFTGVGEGTPTASISGGLTGGVSLTANGVLATTNKQTLQLGNGATGNISVFGLGAGVVQANSAGVLSSSSLNLGSGPVTGILPILNGGTNASSIGSAGSVAYSNGTAYAFTAVGGAGQVLESNGSSAPSWVSVSALNYWNLANGAISPLNETNDLLLGSNATSSAVFAFTGVGGGSTPTASISGGLTGGVSLTANGVLATTNKQTLQLGNGATGNISVFGLGAGVVQANSAGVLSSSSLNLGSGPVTGILPILNGGTNASSIGSAGSVAYSNGTAYAFTAVGGAGQVLESNGSSAPSWVSVSALNYWNLANGAISPLNETNDLLLGSNATSSAVFAFTGVGGGSTPTASISGGLTGGVSLTANGVLATTNKQTLQLGNGATGNISVFGLGAGVVQANSAGVLSSSSLNLGSGPVTGILPILNGGTNASSIGSAGSVAYSNGTAYAFTAVGGAGQVLESNGSSAPSWVSVSALNYWNLANGAISPLNETNDLLLGSNATSSAVFAFTGVGGGSTPTASISGGLTGGVSLTANGVLATTNKQTLQLGNGATGNISVFGLGAGVVQANSAGVLSSSSLNLGSGPVTGILPILNGGTNASSIGSAGSVAYSNGTAYAFTAVGGAGQVLESNGSSAPSWVSVSALNYWNLANGAISPLNETNDLLLGSNATSSAVFAFTGVGGGSTPTASISGGLTGGVSLTANGVLATTNKQTLQLGNGATGNISVFGLGAGVVQANSAGVLSSSSLNLGSGPVTGILPILNGGTNASSIGSAGSVAYSNGTAYAFTAVGGAGQVLESNGSSAPSWVSVSALNYWNLANGAISPLNETNDLLLGSNATSSAVFAFTGVGGGSTPTASISGGLTGGVSLTANGVLATTNKQTLQLGNGATGNISVFGLGAGVVQANSAGVLSSSSLNLGSGPVTGILPILNGGTNASSIGSAGSVAYSNGTAYAFTAVGGAGQVLESNGSSAPSWVSVSALNYWNLANGAISPLNETNDLLLGSNATSSAVFAFTGVGGGSTPTASISGGLTGGVSLTANGVLATTNKQTLQLGNGATGNISVFGLGAGVVQANSAGVLSSSSLNLGSGPVTGILPILNGGTNASSIGSAGSVAYSNGTAYAFTAVGGAGQVLESNGSSAPSWVSVSALNYWNLANGAISPLNETNDLLLGSNATSSAVFAFTGVGGGSTPTASISGGLTGGVSLTANGVLATTNKQTLQLGNGATGNISVFGLGAGVVQANSAGVLSSSSLNLGSGPVTGILPILNGGTNASSIGSAGSVAYSNGTAYAFTAVGGAGQVLESNGSSAPSWVSVSALNYWNLANGAISPLNETNDLLLGSNATSSAVFAFTGVGGGSTPTASISGGLTGGVSLTANGVLATTNKQTLQLGNGATGNISVFGLGAGVVQANSAGVLSSSSLNLGSGPVTGILPVADGGTGANLTLSSLNAQGSIPYFNGSGVMTTLGIGGSGDCLTSNGTIPGWGSCSGSGGSQTYFQLVNGALSPVQTSDDLLLGSTATSSAVFAFTGVGEGTPTASISGGLTGGVSLTANGVLATTNKQTLQLGNGATGNISVFGLGAGVVQANSAGVLSSSSLNLGSGPVTGILPILNGGTNASSIGSAGSVAYSNGTAYAFTAVGGAGQVLESNGSSAPSWVSVSALNYWNLANGAISPLNETNDLLLGSNATSSAVFAFTGVGGGSTPTASISGGLTGGVSLTANGVLATTNKQTLQLGNGATGNISVFGLGAGVVQANSAGVLSSSSLNLGSGPVTGILPILNGGTNASSIGSAGSVAYSNGTAYAFTAVGGAGQVLESNGSSAPSWVSVSALNYWNLANGAISPLNETNDLLLGSNATSSAVFAFTGVGGGSTPTASISGGLTGGVSLTANGVLATTNKQTLQLGNGATGNISVFGLGAGVVQANSAGVLSSSSLNLGSGPVTGILPILNGGTNASSIGSAGSVAYSNGTAYAFTAVGGAGQVLESNGSSAPSWVSVSALNYWNLANGAISPLNETNDLLLGSNATSSAVFAFTGVGGGSTPTASISGGLTGGVSLTANGVLATTNKQTLQLGNGATGNISVFGLGAGVVQANSAGVLSSSSLNLGSGPVTGILPILNGGTNASSIGSAGSVAYSNGTAYAFTAVGGAGQVLESNGSSAPSWVSVSALNYWNLANGAISPLNETNDLLLGSNATSSAVFAFTGVGGGSTPTASISGGLTGGVSLTANGVLATTNKQTLQLGNGATGNISVFGLGAGVVQANSAGVLSSSSLNLGSGPVTGILPILNGGTNASSIGSAGSVAYSNGTAYAFTAVGGAGQVLESNGSSAPSWVSVSALNYWNLANGAISPLNETNDLLLGSNATSSAVFAFTGVGGGSTPTASISGGLTGGVSLTANGVLATTNKQTLQLGNGATGNISVFGLGAGVVQANSAGVLSSSSLNLGSGPVTGILPILNGGTNASSIGSAGSVAYSNGTAYAFTAVGGAGQVLESNGSSAPSWVSVSALNYWNLANGAISPLNETNDLLLGSNATSSAVFAFTGVGGGSTPTASISGGLTGGVSLTANGVLATTNKQTLQLGNGATGNISVFGLGAGVVQANSAGVLSSSSLNLGSGPVTGILPILNGGTNASSIGSAGSVAYSNGTAYAFTAVGGAGQVLESNGSSAPSWVSVSALNYWNLANGAISPLNETNDLLLGSNATSSAVFAFTGVGGGSTPTASISGGLTGGVSLTANGVLATTNKQTLQLGNGATGNISVFGLGAGVVQANSAGVLSSSSLNLGSGPVTGILPILNGGTNASSIGSAGSVAYSNGTAYAFTAVGGAGQVLESNGSSAPSWVSVSALNYWNLANGAISPLNETNDLLLGSNATSSAVFAFTGVGGGSTPTASISGGLTGGVSLTANGVLATTNKQTLQLGNGATGNISVFGLGAGVVQANSAGVLSSSSLNLGSGPVTGILPILNGGTNASSIGSAGSVAYSNGTAYAFTAVGGAGQVLESNGSSAPSWVSVSALNYWNLANGAISPLNETNDLLLGSNATSSAVFAFTGVGGGSTPTASISGGLTGGVSLTANGVLATTNKQTLQLGNGATGNISVFGLGAGVVQANSAGVLSSSSLNLGSGPVTGILPILNGGTNASSIGSAGSVAYSNGTAYAFTAVGGAGQVLESNGSSAPSWVSVSALNYWNLANGAISPLNETNDLLLGSNATSSAVFAFTGVANNTPVASISAVTGSAPNGLSLNGSTSTIQSLNDKTLTIGGNSTGNITLSPLNGLTGSTITLNALTESNAATSINLTGTNPILTATSALQINAGSNTLTFNQGGSGQVQFFGTNNFITSGGAMTLASAGNALNLSGAGANIDFTGAGTGQIITATNQNLALMPGGSGEVGVNVSSGLLATLDVRGNTATAPAASVSATSTYAALDVNNNGTGDLFTASKSGATKFTILNNGNISLNNYNNCGMLTTTGTVLQCSAAPAASTNYWQLNNNVISQGNTTEDLMLGGTSTASAKFAFIGNAGAAIPVASISAQNTAGQGLVFNGSGSIQALNNNTLTIGGNTTGNIAFNPNNVGVGNSLYLASNGNVGIGTTSPQNKLEVNGNINILGSNYLAIGGNEVLSAGSTYTELYNGSGSGYDSLYAQSVYFQPGGATAFGDGNTGAAEFNSLTSNATNAFQLENLNNVAYFDGDSQNLRVGIGAVPSSDTLLGALDVRGSSATLPSATISGATTFAEAVVDQSGTGDLFTASKSGATKFTILNNGNISLNNYNNCGMLTTTGTVLQCSAAPAASTNYWQLNNNVISQGNTTEDLMLGGTSTASAKFAFIGNAGAAIPVASISAQNTAGQGLVFNGSGSIQALNNNTLTIGGNTTGNIAFNPNNVGVGNSLYLAGSGKVGLGNTNPTNEFSVGVDLGATGSPATTIAIGNTSGASILTVGQDNTNRGALYWSYNATPSLAYLDLTTNGGQPIAIQQGGGLVGIGTTAPLATLDVRSSSATLAVASVSGATNFASLVVDQSGSGDIFTASKSGATKFVITNAGNVGIGTATPSAQLTVAGNISNLANLNASPVQVASTSATSGLSKAPNAVAISGKYAYVTDTQGRFVIFDITNPAQPYPVGSITSGLGTPGQVVIQGKYAYIANEGGSFIIVDVSNPAQPKIVGSVSTGLSYPSGVAVQGRYAFVTDYNNSDMEVFDVTNPTKPAWIYTTPSVGGNASDVYIQGKYAYEANWSGRLNIFDISNPYAPTIVGHVNGGSSQSVVAVSGDYAYVADLGSGLVIYNVSNPYSPTVAAVTKVGSSGMVGVAVSGRYAYTTDLSAKLNVYDVLNPGLPLLVGTSNFGAGLSMPFSNDGALAISGDYAFVPAQGTGTSNGALLDYNLGGGIDTQGLMAESAEVGSLNVDTNEAIGSELTIGGGLSVAGDSEINGNLAAIGGLNVLNTATNSGTVAVASIAANTSFAAMVVDQSGSGDIFTASSSGLTQFIITQGGNVEVGNSYPVADGLQIGNNGVNANPKIVYASDYSNSVGFANFVGGWNSYSLWGIGPADGSNYDNLLRLGVAGINPNGTSFWQTNQTLNLAVGGNLGVGVGSSNTAMGYAALTVNQPNTYGDLFSASSSGVTKFDINNIGSVGIGTTSQLATLDVRGNTATTPAASVSATSTYAAVDVNNNGLGDLFTASKSGATKFTILNNGNIQMNNYTQNGGVLFTSGTGVVSESAAGSTGQVLQLVGNTPTWVSAGAAGVTQWQLNNNGTISQFNLTNDLLLGGTSTASADFAFTGLSTATPIASISAIDNGGNKNGISLNASTGTIQSLQNQTLTIGGNTTGNIAFSPNNVSSLYLSGNGGVGIGTTSPLATLDVRGNSGTTPIASISGKTAYAGFVVDNSGVGSIFTASASGATRLVLTNGGSLDLVGGQTSDIDTLTGDALTIGATNASTINIGKSSGQTLSLADNAIDITGLTGGTSNQNSILYLGASGALTDSANTTTANLCLLSGASSPTWGSCDLGTTAWKQLNGAIYPGNSTEDLLVGGTATGSAKFAFINVNNGTPTASISAGTSGAVSLTAQGVLATTANQSLTLGSAGSGNVVINPGGGNPEMVVQANGQVGIGTTTPLATLDLRGNSGTTPVASISGASSFAGLVVNNSGSGDIFTASASGLTRFTIKNSGVVVIGTNTNGITLDPTGSAGFLYAGTARPTRQIVLSPEYAGAVITASNSANTNGFMTASASQSATPNSFNYENYYSWSSTQTSLNDYTVAVTVSLPKDFSAWPTSGNAITIDFNTALTTPADNALDVYIYNKGDTSGVPVYFITNQTSGVAGQKTWTTINITGAQLSAAKPWNLSVDNGQAVIYLKMHAMNTVNYVQVGDIKINYLSAF